MPLQDLQHSFIKERITSILATLPEEKDQFLTEVENMKKAFRKELNYLDSLYYFQEWIYNPEQFLFGIPRTYGHDFTVGEVQEYVLDCITLIIQQAATKVGVKSDQLAWSKLAMRRLIRDDEQHDEKFVPDDQMDPRALIGLENRVYSGRIITNDEHRFTQITFSIDHYPSLSCAKTYNYDYPSTYFMYAELEAFDKDKLKEAENKFLYDMVVPRILRELVKNDIIDENSKNRASDSAKLLLTHRVYYELVKQKKLLFSQMIHLSEAQYFILRTPTVINKIKTGEYTFAEALKHANEKIKFDKQQAKINYSEDESLIVNNPYYREKLKQGIFKYKTHFKGLTRAEALNLLTPPAIQLIERGIVHFDQIKSMSVSARRLLADQVYFDSLVSGKLKFITIASINEEMYSYLHHPRILSLVPDLLTPNDLTLPIVKSLIKHPGFYDLVKAKKLLPTEFHKMSLDGLADGFAMRVDAVVKQNLYLEEDDTLEKIRSDCIECAATRNVPEVELTQRIIKSFLLNLQKELEKDLDLNNAFIDTLYRKIYNIISAANDDREMKDENNRSEKWQKAAGEIIKLVEERKKAIPTKFVERSSKRMKLDGFFAEVHSKESTRGLITFCDQILSLTDWVMKASPKVQLKPQVMS